MSREEGSLNGQNSNSGRRVINSSINGGRNSSEEEVAALSNVTRVMRSVLPPNVRIAEDAKQVVLDGVSEFISVIAADAIDHRSGVNQGRANTTLRSEDVLDAMERLGFDDYIEPHTLFLHRYRRAQAAREAEANPPTSSSSSSSGQAAGGGGDGGVGSPGGGVPSLESPPQREENNGDDHNGNGSSV